MFFKAQSKNNWKNEPNFIFKNLRKIYQIFSLIKGTRFPVFDCIDYFVLTTYTSIMDPVFYILYTSICSPFIPQSIYR